MSGLTQTMVDAIPLIRMPSWRVMRARLCVLVILMTLAQGLIPAGFMPSTDAGSLFQVCPGHMDMPADGEDLHPGHRQHHHSTICPFAAAAVIGAAPSLGGAQFAILGAALLLYSVFSFPPRGLSGPPRAQTPRAPPAFHS